jgi:RNA polymerase sigma-70 factor (ECF subfamily)
MDWPTYILVERAQLKDAEAFVALFRRFERRARAIAYRVLRSSEMSNDALQEALLRAWERLPDLRDPRHFGTWFCGIVHNVAVNELRKQRDGRSLAGIEARPDHEPACSPVERLMRREGCQRLRDAIAALDETSRLAVVMRYYDDHVNEEIAQLLDITPTATNMRLFRARRRMRKMLQYA